MDFEQIDILQLLPQRPPFILVDKLLYYDFETTRTSFEVCEDGIFCDNGHLSEAGIVENIAQTCATRTGYYNSYIKKDAVKIGFIGAIRNQKFFRLPKIGEVLTTEIRTVQEVFQTTLVNATVHSGKELISSCEMKISITDMQVEEN